MSYRTLCTAVVFGLALMAAAQQTEPGYREHVAVRGKTTIRTAAGAKSVDLTVESLIIPNDRKVTVRLPERGFALFQFFGGEAEVIIGDQRRKPLEGEWVTVALPARVVIATGGDTANVDVILIGE
jgi:hypothetical protein